MFQPIYTDMYVAHTSLFGKNNAYYEVPMPQVKFYANFEPIQMYFVHLRPFVKSNLCPLGLGCKPIGY